MSLDASKVINVTPRYGKLHANDPKEIIGWENIELIADRPLEIWIEEFKKIKDAHPEGVLIASVMEEFNKDGWIEIIERCEAAGVDAFELNLSCPHGLPERAMGSAMGQDPEIVREVCEWVASATKKPVWAKMTPNITHIEDPARAALEGGSHGLSAINTIRSVIGVNLETPPARTDGGRLHNHRRLFVQGGAAYRPAHVHGAGPAHQDGLSWAYTFRARRYRDRWGCRAVHSPRVRHRAGLHGG